MGKLSYLRAVVVAIGLTAMVPGATLAQEITESHLAAAREAVASAKVSRGIDNLLPLVSEQTQNRLIRVRPDLHKEVSEVVEGIALSMANRRVELDNDIARVWAKSFTEPELKQLTAFYKSAAGSKLADIGPKVLSDSLQTAKRWSDRVGEEMLEKSRAELKKKGLDF